MRSAPNKKRETGLFKEVWVAYNNLVDFCREIAPQQSGSHGVMVDRKSNGTSFKISSVERSNTELKMFIVKSVHDDYITCRNWDGEHEGISDIKIAKPFELRKTGWHGVTVTYTLETTGATRPVTYSYLSSVYRTATSGSTVEWEAIRPPYVPNKSVIYAAKSTNGTGVTDAPDLVEMSSRAFAKLA